jgi:hypothetical protein
MTTNKKRTIEDVEEEFEKVFLIKDKTVVRFILASIIGNQMDISDKPIWPLLVAGSSGGKSALLETLAKLPFVHYIDTLTTSTLASGYGGGSEEASLLHKANNGILVFKDFTVLTTMNEDALREIMGQFRAVYDGTFDKKTGNTKNTAWKGKIGILAGGTMAAQLKIRQYSDQGERFINYHIEQPDRLEMTRRAVANQKGFKEKLSHLQDVVYDFVMNALENVDSSDLEIKEEIREEMIQVADFATQARSPVVTDKWSGELKWVPDKEMPARMAGNLSLLAHVFMIISSSRSLNDLSRSAIYKTALDSIPPDRLVVLRTLTKYEYSTTKSMATKLGYPTDTVRLWCEQLTALKLVERIPKGTAGFDSGSDSWRMKVEHRNLMSKFEGIEILREPLYMEEGAQESYDDDRPLSKEADERLLRLASETADDIFDKF